MNEYVGVADIILTLLILAGSYVAYTFNQKIEKTLIYQIVRTCGCMTTFRKLRKQGEKPIRIYLGRYLTLNVCCMKK